MLLYISKAFEDNIGATMHYHALQEIYGEDNVLTVDLRPIKACKTERYICYGKYRNPLDRIHRWLQGNMMFISNKIISEICDMIAQNKVNVVFIEDSVFGNLVRRIKRRYPDVQVITFYHDIKADLYRQWIAQKKKMVSKIEYTVGIRQERMNQKYADMNLVFNQREVDTFLRYYGKLPDSVLPLPAPIPSIPEDVKNRITPESSKKKLLFVGKNYYPNLIGLQWFVDQVLPQLSDNIQVDVVGRGLEVLQGRYTDPRIHIIGGVDCLTPYYLNADIVIAPLFDGGGMKTKTVEAISYGKVFVGTQESLVGFWEELGSDIQNKIVFQSDRPDQWVEIINGLAASDVASYHALLFDLFTQKFSYEVIKDKLLIMMKNRGNLE